MDTVAVIGAGTMGNGIAHICAGSGRQVLLLDSDPAALERARATIASNLDRQLRKEQINASERVEILERISTHTGVAGHVRGADVVIEAVSERKEVKQAVFEVLSRETHEDALLASNTSSISITWLGSLTRNPARVVGMHFFNPVPVMRLVEVVRGVETGEEAMRRARAFAASLGKTPVLANDAPGFVSNRVLMPMINEAIFCVMEGVAEPDAVDDVMKLGMAHPMGPLALADLIGLDVCLDIMEVLHRELGDDKYRPCPLLRQYVYAGRLGRKSGRGFFDY